MPGPWAILRAAAQDRSSGAAEIARRAAGALGTVPAEEVRKGVELLLAGHPAMAPLWRLGTEVLSAGSPAEGAAGFLAAGEADRQAARVAAAHLPPWVLTISYSSSVLDAVRDARIQVLACMESLPGGEGRRMAEEASRWKRTRVVPDDEALHALPGAAVLVGADAVTPAGVVNKVKTRALAEAAAAKGAPCYAVAGGTKFVEEPLPAEDGLENVPLELFEGIATPAGILTPEEAAAQAREASIHPDLRPLLRTLRAGSRR